MSPSSLSNMKGPESASAIWSIRSQIHVTPCVNPNPVVEDASQIERDTPAHFCQIDEPLAEVACAHKNQTIARKFTESFRHFFNDFRQGPRRIGPFAKLRNGRMTRRHDDVARDTRAELPLYAIRQPGMTGYQNNLACTLEEFGIEIPTGKILVQMARRKSPQIGMRWPKAFDILERIQNRA